MQVSIFLSIYNKHYLLHCPFVKARHSFMSIFSLFILDLSLFRTGLYIMTRSLPLTAVTL